MVKIKVENINKTFNLHRSSPNRVLKNVSLEFPDKGLVAIFGKSGSGKTTLLNIMGGLDRQDSGKIYIDGEDTAGKVDEIRNNKIGFIFQNYYLESGYTITEILRNQMLIAGLKDEEEISKRTEEVLALVDMERYKNKRADALSGGQKQRVAIARALIKGSDIILADEPTGNLDTANTVKVMEILKKISKTQLVVLVTHEINLIKRYADSHIKLVDGEMVADGKIEESELTECQYGDADCEIGTVVFHKSFTRKNGRLFNLHSVLKSIRNESGEKIYSAATLFKQIFIFAMAAVMCIFSLSLFDVLNAQIENKNTGVNTVYVNMNTYGDLRRFDDSIYSSIDFFETQMKKGGFSYENMPALSGYTLDYVPKFIDKEDSFDNIYGQMPAEKEILISRKLAENLKKELRISELKNDASILLINFEGEYKISGIVEEDEPAVYMNKIDYVNFIGVYSSLYFSDVNELFFDNGFVSNAFTTEICLAKNEMDLKNNEVQVEINRNSLYKMMNDITSADYKAAAANSKISSTRGTSTAIYIVDSKPMYVQKFIMTREIMDTDIKIYINDEALRNIFFYLSPNLDSLKKTVSASGIESDYYFAVSASNGQQLSSLKSVLKERGITAIDVDSAYEKQNEEILSEQAKELIIYVVMAVLLFLIYFFIEKSESIKNSKEYGIYRAIGVNRGNLIYREAFTAFFRNIISYTVFFTIFIIIICVRYFIMNVDYGEFIALSAGTYVLTALLMIIVSVIPYLFVFSKTPSEILSRYDI